jgi:fumarate reductase flavoprotein subunit
LIGPGFNGSRILKRVIREPYTIWVNSRGERFTDESIGSNPFEAVNAIYRQPGNNSYTLVDDKMIQDITQHGFVLPNLGVLYGGHIDSVPSLEKDLWATVGKGSVKISESWKQIADWIGADPKVLKSTIKEYNSGCDQGYDHMFAKDRRYLLPLRTPPYYALECYPEYLTTIGGIKINRNMEVVNKAGGPIPGLFAAGNDTGGWESGTYCVLLSGSTMGFAINSGRIAGENAAGFINSTNQ